MSENEWPSAFTVVGLGLCGVLMMGAMTQCATTQNTDHINYRIACINAGNIHTKDGCVQKDADAQDVVRKLNELLEKVR